MADDTLKFPGYLMGDPEPCWGGFPRTDAVYDLGAKRELFVDDFFIRSLDGDVSRRVHKLIPDEVILTLDEPHEFTNNSGCYNSLLYDGKRYLYYYRAHARFGTPSDPEGNMEFIFCVAESYDGINFKRCQVNLHPSGYNVVLDNAMTAPLVGEAKKNHCPGVTVAFYDTNPACPETERYKLIVTQEGIRDGALFLFVSADGFDFKQKTGRFDLASRSGYDSPNQAFYDANIGKYRLYHRGFRSDGGTWKRTIMTHVTEDFVTFTEQAWLKFDAAFDALFAQGQELYTNGIRPYFRAPHILLGFPMRYVDGSMTPGMHLPSPYWEENPNTDHDGEWNCRLFSRSNLAIRKFHVKKQMRYALAATETVLLASRDGVNFQGTAESILTPPPQDDSWFYGAGTVAIGMAVTKSKFAHGAPDELSFYSPENCWGEGAARIRRYHIRMDGFVSLHFAASGGELTTPYFTFSGGRLSLNIATGAFGGFTAEFRDENGTPIPGYTFADSLPEIGDDIEMIARWKNCGPDLRALEGKVVQLAIRAKNADLYSLAFVPYQDDPELPPYK